MKVSNTTFFKVGDNIIVTADCKTDIQLNDILHNENDDSKWLVVGLGRRELGTPKDRIGLTIKPMNHPYSIPKNGTN